MKKPDFGDKHSLMLKFKSKLNVISVITTPVTILEPDLKYSPGGLRDLHLLYWIALRHTGEMTLDGILKSGFIYPSEHQQLLESQEFFI